MKFLHGCRKWIIYIDSAQGRFVLFQRAILKFKMKGSLSFDALVLCCCILPHELLFQENSPAAILVYFFIRYAFSKCCLLPIVARASARESPSCVPVCASYDL